MTENAYKKILIPFDGSVFSQKALTIGKTFAKANDATLYLLTVVDISDVSPPGLIRSKETRKTLEEIKDAIKRSAKAGLEQREQECKGEKIKTISYISEGTVSNEILKFIEKNNIDLVIIGSHGLSGFSKLKALGSTSRKVSELSDCPVIIVH